MVSSLGFSISCNLLTVIVLLLPFQFGFLLFLFSYLMTVARNSNTIMNKSEESGNSFFFFPDFRGNVSAFHC